MNARRLRVDNYAMPNLMPCIVVGFDGAALASSRDDNGDDESRRVMLLEVQAGGLSCAHESAVGFVLRLASAQEFARQDPWPLVRGFQDISDDTTWTAGPSERIDLSDTSGESFTAAQLRMADEILAKYFRLPPLMSGMEAFCAFDVVDTLAFFEDWPVWTLARKAGGESDTGDIYVFDSNIADFDARDDDRFSAAHVRHLERFAARNEIDSPVRAFLAWGNSD